MEHPRRRVVTFQFDERSLEKREFCMDCETYLMQKQAVDDRTKPRPRGTRELIPCPTPTPCPKHGTKRGEK
jgi:hypothetical protein